MTVLEIARDVQRRPVGKLASAKFCVYNPPSRQFSAALCPEEEGGFSIVALHLPGVVSQGDTEEEAVENIREAFLAMLESCQKHIEPLPFSTQPVIELKADGRQIWVKVDA